MIIWFYVFLYFSQDKQKNLLKRSLKVSKSLQSSVSIYKKYLIKSRIIYWMHTMVLYLLSCFFEFTAGTCLLARWDWAVFFLLSNQIVLVSLYIYKLNQIILEVGLIYIFLRFLEPIACFWNKNHSAINIMYLCLCSNT